MLCNPGTGQPSPSPDRTHCLACLACIGDAGTGEPSRRTLAPYATCPGRKCRGVQVSRSILSIVEGYAAA